MSVPAAVPIAAATRPGYDPDADATARRVLPMLAGERVVWLSTVCPDGRPHLVPTWFWWDGAALLLWSKPEAVKVRNLRADPRVMVALGDAGADFSVGLIEARAELAQVAVPDAFFAKYRGELADGRLDREAFSAAYTQAVRVVPTRILGWHGRGGRGERHGAAGRAGGARWSWARPAVTARLAAALDRIAVRLRGSAPAGVMVAT
jgi:PPOX class probable F420-dependent enzyme